MTLGFVSILSVWTAPSPAAALLTLMVLSAAAMIVDLAARHRRRSELRQLALQWQMAYSPHDRLRVGEKVAHHFPIPGAADVLVTDVIYGSAQDVYRYFFTIEFTTGIIRGKRRQVRVAAFEEPRCGIPDQQPGQITLAPQGLKIIEQYCKVAPASSVARASSGASS